jgi:transcriptional regulator with XRE-family HTH domain
MELGVKPPSVSDWESGKTNPSMENLKLLAELYGVTTDYLLGREEAQQKAPADPMQERRAHLLSLLMQFTDEEIQRFEDFAAGVLASRK